MYTRSQNNNKFFLNLFTAGLSSFAGVATVSVLEVEPICDTTFSALLGINIPVLLRLSFVVIKRATLAPLPLAVSICCAVIPGALGDGLTSLDWCVVECFLNFEFVRLSSSGDALPRPAVSGLALLPIEALFSILLALTYSLK